MGRPLLRLVYSFLKDRGLLVPYRVVGVELVARRGGERPSSTIQGKTTTDHHDKKTGSLAYQRVRAAGAGAGRCRGRHWVAASVLRVVWLLPLRCSIVCYRTACQPHCRCLMAKST